MLHLFERRPDFKSAHIFADHLEATLDLAEELELLHLILPERDSAADTDVLTGLDRIGAFVERIEVIELAIAAKLDLARAAARRLADRDARLSTFSKLFHAGTQSLVDLYPALADPGSRIFDSGHDPLTFLQARGTIDESRCTLEDQRYLGTGEEYLLLGTVKLGAFIELCDTCLKAVDRHFHLYENDAEWEAGRASTLEVLRERRDEAIRRALGAQAPIIEAPVEIVPADAVDEAIELIEGLTFPEEQRFHPETPELQPEPAQEEPPVELAPETVEAEEAPIELPADAIDDEAEATVEIEAELAQEIVIVADDTPEEALSLDADAIVVEPDVSALASNAELESAPPAATAEPALETACPVETPAIKPRLLTPFASARKSLLSFLARRRADPPEAGEAPATADAETLEAAQVEAAIETITIEALSGPMEDPVALAATRQRLVALIAERARLPSEKAPQLDADPVPEAPEQALIAEAPQQVSDVAEAAVETETQATSSVPAVDESNADREVPPEADGEEIVAVAASIEPVSAEPAPRKRRKRKDRASRRRSKKRQG
ncbi:MAG: hypothetical protein U1E49_02360 [Hyphomicrobiaceae bacterium]